MNCPKCGAEFGVPHIVSKTDVINGFGRRVLDFKVEQETYIIYENGTYHCSKCGHSFSEREAYLQ